MGTRPRNHRTQRTRQMTKIYDNMFNWLFNFSRNRLEVSAVKQKMREEQKYREAPMNMAGAQVSIDRGMSSDANLNFKMYKAVNGFVMEVRQYDKRTDRNVNELYLITDEQDLGEEIAKIITLESMKV
jgi:hypothetical protein